MQFKHLNILAINFFHRAVLHRNYFIVFLKTHCNLKQITKDFKRYVCSGTWENILLVKCQSNTVVTNTFLLHINMSGINSINDDLFDSLAEQQYE